MRGPAGRVTGKDSYRRDSDGEEAFMHKVPGRKIKRDKQGRATADTEAVPGEGAAARWVLPEAETPQLRDEERVCMHMARTT